MIKKNIFYSILINLLNLGYPLISFTYVARILNPEGIGLFNYALSIVGYFLVFSNLGIPRIAPVEISKAKDNSHLLYSKINGYFSLNLITTIIIMFLYIISLLLFAEKNLFQTLLLILSIQIIANCIGLDWLMQGMMHFKQLIIRDLSVKILSLILLFLLVKNSSDILIYAILYIFSTLISSLVNYYYLKKKYKIKLGYKYIISHIEVKQLLINVFPISILTTVYLFFDTSLAGYFLTMHDVGIYSFSIKIVRLLLLIFDSVFVVLTPVLAYKLAQKNDISEINYTFNVIISNLFGLFLPLCFLVFIFSNSIVFFLGGEKFLESALILKLLMPMAFFYIYSSILGSQVLYNIGELSVVRNILLVVLLISLLFGVIFIKKMKLFGIVLTINLSFFLLTLCYYISALKSIKGIKLFSLRYIYKYFFASALPYLIYIITIDSIPYKNFTLNIFIGSLYVIFYIIILFLLNEKYLIKNINKILITKKNV